MWHKPTNTQNERILTDPKLDAEATVGMSFSSFYGTAYAEIDTEIKI